MKGLTEQALQHIVERPKHIDLMGSTNASSNKLVKMAETLKLMDRTKSLCYDKAEFEREFSAHKNYGSYLKKRLMSLGVKKPRFVKDGDKVWIWSNDERN